MKTSLNAIAHACEQYDIDEAKDLLEQLNQKQFSKNHKKLIKEIANHLLYGDFEDAALLAIQFASQIAANER